MDISKGKEVVSDNEDYCDIENKVDNEDSDNEDYCDIDLEVDKEDSDNEEYCEFENKVEIDDSQLLQKSSPNITEPQEYEYAKLSYEEIVAKQFHCLEEAELFYWTYAKQVGFGVQNASLRKRKDGSIAMKMMVCHKEGRRDEKWYKMVMRKRKPKLDFREDCPARFKVNRDRGTGKWVVSKFVMEQSHELMPQPHVHFVSSFRNIDAASSKEITALRLGGVLPRHICDIIARQSGGYDKMGFTPVDVKNKIQSEKGLEPPNGDITAVLSYFSTKKLSDEGYYFSHTTDADNRLEHLFWSDSSSRSDYTCFGDVIAFDSAYKRNRYNRPLVFIIGINHHHQSIIFSTAVIANKTTESYVWLLNELIRCMGGKKPISVVTDGDCSMAAALREVLPDSCHRLCSYHLLQNARKNIKNTHFFSEFNNLIFDRIDEDEFQERWKELIIKCELVNNEWISKVYTERHMWAECFMMQTFFGGTRTTSRCEGMHSFLDVFLKRRLSFSEFVQRFETVLAKIRENEAEFDHRCRYGKIFCKHPFKEFEIPASEVYTCKSFDIFQDQLNEVVAYHDFAAPTRFGMVVSFYVKRYSSMSAKFRTVTYDIGSHEVTCSCHLFESTGFPCRHQLFILKKVGLSGLPNYLFLPRWTKDAKSLTQSITSTTEFPERFLYDIRIGNLNISFRRLSTEACKTAENYNKVRQCLSDLTDDVYGSTVTATPFSTNVLDPRLPGKKDMARKPVTTSSRRCSLCKQTGHTKAKCQNIEQAAPMMSHNLQIRESSSFADQFPQSHSAIPDTATGLFYTNLPTFWDMNCIPTQESVGDMNSFPTQSMNQY